MTVADAAFERRKAAILIGLRAALDETAAQSALDMWAHAYGPTRPLAIVDFVADLERLQALPPKRSGAVRLALYQALIQHDAPKARVAAPSPPAIEPAAAAVEPPPVAVPPAASDRPAMAIFRALTMSLRIGIDASGPAAQREFAIALARAGTVARVKPADLLLVWFASQSWAALADADDARLADTLHAIYVAAAETLGPVQADRLLSRAVSEAQALPESRLFPPSRLL